MGFGLQGSGVEFGVGVVWYRVQSAGCRVQGAGCRVQGAGCRVWGVGYTFQGVLRLGARSRISLSAPQNILGKKVTWDFHGEPGFMIRPFLVSSGYSPPFGKGGKARDTVFQSFVLQNYPLLEKVS